MSVPPSNRPTIVVIGNGMVGHRFCERMVELDTNRRFQIITFCEEPRAAYDRVGLTQFFAHQDAQKLAIANIEWYRENDIAIYLNERAIKIDREKKIVVSNKGTQIHYDYIVLATGSYPFVPEVPGIKNEGVFVYRTIEDLEKIIAYGKKSKRAAVIGGGLLGLEAAKAAFDLDLETHVIEFASRLMPRQVDDRGSQLLTSKIKELGVQVHLNKATKAVLGKGKVTGLQFNDDSELDVDMVIVSAGIRPRDELAKQAELRVGDRGGVIVDDCLRTSDYNIFAIGEVALHGGVIYGLVAPGYEMADVVANVLCGKSKTFSGTDLSAKLKLMGVDVASFGDAFADQHVVHPARALVMDDPFSGVYKKLLISEDGTRILGGILVGDASEYGSLLARFKSSEPLSISPSDLLFGLRSDTANSAGDLPSDAQVCSCNNVTRAQLCDAIRGQELITIDDVKRCTRAGTGCGGCVPLLNDILKAELKSAGKKVNDDLCGHFQFTRQELMQICQVKEIKTFNELIASHGQGNGCEICKPTVASIFASLWNENVLDHANLQDTNDRFLANIQRGGLYSVVPRVPGGEITPDKLIILGQIAKKYNLYTKITGGQRIDLFGAAVHQLPEIWEELVKAGFESGHAYGKALRTVKSCVGTTWCRYGVQDSVGLAIRVENRYRGLRSPHKLKAAVSGCTRECAEAQSKDFGLIATENGYNLYVCGNGGTTPRHADLLAADLDEQTCIKLIDRFLMFYIRTADRLMRTSVWLGKLDGGIDYLRDVVVNDRLGINDELEKQMQYLVDTYECEWKAVVNDPERRKFFRQFINTDATEPSIEFVQSREQHHPAPWPNDFVSLEQFSRYSPLASPDHAVDSSIAPSLSDKFGRPSSIAEKLWVRVGKVADFPEDSGATVKYGPLQIAVFNFASRNEWYACQNLCPHKRELVLSRGIIGDQAGIPKVACPLHKKTFSLETGECLTGEEYRVTVYSVKTDEDSVFILLDPLTQSEAGDIEIIGFSKTCENAIA